MEATIRAGHGPVDVATDADGLSLRVSGRDFRWHWSELTGAGFAHHPLAGRTAPDLPDEVAQILPGFRQMRDLGTDLGSTHEALVLAWRAARPKSLQVFLPTADPGTVELQADLAAHLGDRWHGTSNELEPLRRSLGVGYPRWYALVATGIAWVIGFVTVLPGLLGFEKVGEAIADLDPGKLAEIQPVSWIAMAVWVLIVGWLLARLGRRLGRA
jgi:hypothetical protein